jgi:hypothetical protein
MMGSVQVMVIAGPQTAALLGQLDLHDKVVIYVPPDGLDAAARRVVLSQLLAQSRGVLVAVAEDSTAFASDRASVPAESVKVADYLWNAVVPRGQGRWAVALRPSALAGLLGAVGFELPALRTAATPLAQEVPDLQVWLWILSQDTAKR